MSEVLTYPVEGISQLTIETLARDAAVRGMPDATAVQITYRAGDRPAVPEFIPEGRGVRFSHGVAERVLAPQGLAITVKEALGDVRAQNLTAELSLEAVHGDMRLEALTGPVFIDQADADIRAEAVADLRITGACDGDLRFANGGNLNAEEVSGDVRISSAADVQIRRVHGDLWAEKLSGGLTVQAADGDARINDIAGATTLRIVAGDLRGSSLAGGLAAGQVNGDAVLNGPFTAADGYTLAADGDVHVHLPADADVRLIARAAGRIRSDISLTPAADGTPTYSASVGAGATRLEFTSSGDLRVTRAGAEEVRKSWARHHKDDPVAEFANLGERIRQQVTASLASAGIDIETGEFKGNRGWRGFRPPRPPIPPVPPTPPERPKPPERAKPATTEEQLSILRMVEEGRITPEEADALLKALGA